MRINGDVPWRLEQLTEPTAEPMEVDEARDEHVRLISDADEHAYFQGLIKVAREHAEGFLRRPLITQDWVLFLDRFPRHQITVPLPPLQSITTIEYIDTTGALVTWAAAEYKVSGQTTANSNAIRPPRARIRPAWGLTWPTVRGEQDAVKVTFKCGYGDNGKAVPATIKHGMKLIIGELYVQRKQSLQDVFQHPAVISAENLWWRYKLH